MKTKKKAMTKKQSKQGLDATGLTLSQRYQAGYHELQTQVINLQREVAELKRMQEAKSAPKPEPKKEYKRPRVKKDNDYFTIEVGGWVHVQTEKGNNFDNANYAMGNYYLSEEAAEREADRQIILQQLKDLAMELNAGERVDWRSECDNEKYYINLFCNTLTLEETYDDQTPGAVYCLSPDFLDVALKRIGEERLKKLFEEK